MAVVVGAVLAAPLSRLPPQDGRADELHGGEDDEADAGREEREEPEEPGGDSTEIKTAQTALCVATFLLERLE